jgi:hypothetical protein
MNLWVGANISFAICWMDLETVAEKRNVCLRGEGGRVLAMASMSVRNPMSNRVSASSRMNYANDQN